MHYNLLHPLLSLNRLIVILVFLLLSEVLFGRIPACSIETAEQALPYALIVEANTHDAIQEAYAPGYHPLFYDDLPASIQLFAHATLATQGMQTISNLLFFDLDDALEEEITPSNGWIESHSIHYLGIFARIYENEEGSELVLAFRGTEPDAEKNPDRFTLNWMTNTLQGLGQPSIVYEFAAKLAAQLKAAFPKHKITCTGISLGGGLAQYAAAMNQLSAYCFNSPALGEESLRQIENQELQQQGHGPYYQRIEQHITHIHVRGDILQDVLSVLEIVLSTEHSKLGHQCAIPPHDGLTKKSSNLLKKLKNKFKRHYTENLVPSFKLFLEKLDTFEVSEEIC